MRPIYYVSLLAWLLISINKSHAQNNDSFWTSRMQEIAKPESQANWIYFKENSQLNPNTIFETEKSAFGLNEEVCMVLIKVETDDLGFTRHIYQQYYKGLKVEGATFYIHSQNSQVVKANGHISPLVPLESAFSVMEVELIEARPQYCTMDWLSVMEVELIEARDIAINEVDASIYLWEKETEEDKLKVRKNDPSASHYPQGDLVFKQMEEEGDSLLLCYVFEVPTWLPIGGKRVYVNAKDGSIVYTKSLLESCVHGTACTKYNGTQTIETLALGANYTLHDDCRGTGITTNEYNPTGDNYRIYNSTNTWNDDCPATSAHWAAGQAYDYFLYQHNRNGLDELGLGFEVVMNVDNMNIAGWHRATNSIYIGDNIDNNITDYPVSLDIIGHEITHGVIRHIDSLGTILNAHYQETEALTESFCDIFGTLIEFYAEELYDLNKNGDYILGEDFWKQGVGYDGYTRSLKDPKAKTGTGTNSPGANTYKGDYWSGFSPYPYAGVQNYWFYLLAEGGSGANDHGYCYQITGIGKEAAAQIVYRNLMTYMEWGSKYDDVRAGAINAAEDIFGIGSFEVEQVKLAWDAVGVYSEDPYPAVEANLTLCDDLSEQGLYVASADIVVAGDACSSSNNTHTYLNNGEATAILAGQSITFEKGFHAQSGSTICAAIQECMPGGELTGKRSQKPERSNERQVEIKEVSISISASPNPFTAYTDLTFELVEGGLVDIYLYDILGNARKVVAHKTYFPSGKNRVRVDGADLQAGFYICEIQSGNRKGVMKLVYRSK